MNENIESSNRLSREDLKRLMAKSDGPALSLFSVQLLSFAVLSLATISLAAAHSPLRWLGVVATGLVLLMFFASMHEAGHGTAFASPGLNRIVSWISAVLMLQSPTFFREFHFEHHRRTSDPEGDPEISGAPSYLAPWPGNPLRYVAQAAGQHLMVGKAVFTIVAALLPPDSELFTWLFPYVRTPFRRDCVRECRIVTLLWIAALWFGSSLVPGFAFWLLAWPIGHLALGLFVMPEHTGLGSQGTQLHRTRSMRSNALVQRAMWHMSWHAEHHGYPAVPFHALPELHRRLEPELENTIPGYLAFHAEALSRSLGR